MLIERQPRSNANNLICCLIMVLVFIKIHKKYLKYLKKLHGTLFDVSKSVLSSLF